MQPRLNDLLQERFPLDALVNIAAALGQRVHVDIWCIETISQLILNGNGPRLLPLIILIISLQRCYLDLALRTDAMLATFDRELAEAMHHASGTVFSG